MHPITMLFLVALSVGMILLIKELSRLQARVWSLERRLENAKVSVTTHCGPNPHNHKAVVSFPTPAGKTQ